MEIITLTIPCGHIPLEGAWGQWFRYRPAEQLPGPLGLSQRGCCSVRTSS